MTVSENKYNQNIVQIFALLAAGVLLNFGLFFILSILTPLVVGFISGFFFFRYSEGALVGTLSAALSYTIIFIVTATMTIDIIGISSAVLIMSILGLFGSILGVLFHRRSS